MSPKPVAVISDIHGNRWALRAVLEDIERRGVERVVNLGDSFYGPLDPAGTARMLIGRGMPTVRGNEDRVLVVASPEEAHSPSLEFTRNSLAAEHMQWLEALEMTAIAYADFFLCHGTPERDDEYLLQRVSEEGACLRTPSEVEGKVGHLDRPVVLCGHDHVARTMRLPNGMLVVAPGSVGLPAYRDELPYPHVMESGTPHARYSVVRWCPDGWQAEAQTVEYEWDVAAGVALKNHRPDWARWLRTGRAIT